MFESIMKLFKKLNKKENKASVNSKDAAKERLHLVLMQDRANVSADFLELMKQEIIDVIKKYIDVDENAIDVRLTNKENEDGTNGAPALYANIPIINIKNETKKVEKTIQNEEKQEEVKKEDNLSEDEGQVNIEKEKNKDIVENVEIENKEIEQKEDSQNNEDAKEEIKSEN